jgi:multiple sugar transport system permease protein
VSRRETRAAYAFLSPWLFGAVFLTAGPVLASLALSFTDYNALGSPHLVGIDNYERAATDPQARSAMGNTVVYTALYVPSVVLVGLGVAMLLQRAGRATGLYRTLIYLPVITPPVATGVVFLLLLNGQEGALNTVLGALHLPTPYWTTDPDWIKPGIVLMALWSVGSIALILLAALQDVPRQLEEAAWVDGAGPWRRFRHVTLPMISPALLFATVISSIAAMQLFTEVYTMYFGTATTQAPDEAVFYVIYLFEQGFRFLDMGYASALAWLLFLAILALTWVQLRLSRNLVHYRGA